MITEKIYCITYNSKDCSYEENMYCIADTIEEAIEMAREYNKGSNIKEVRYCFSAKRKSTKTITVEV